MTTYVCTGDRIPYTPTTDVAAGDVVVQGDLVGVATSPIAADTAGTVAVRGVFSMPKSTGTGTAVTAGAKLYWNATNSVVTTSDGSGTNKLVGKAIAAATVDDTTVHVLLTQ